MGFRKAETIDAKKLPIRINLWGEPKSGKTTFALSAPRPLWFFNFDHGVRELLALNPDLARDVMLADYYLPANPTIAQGEEVLQQFVDDWAEATAEVGGTLVLDTGTQLKELVNFVKMHQVLEEKIRKAAAIAAKGGKAFDPDMVQIMRPDYAARNQLMNAILSLPALTDHKNVVYVWKAREKYSGNGAPTGQYEGDLFKDAPYIAQGTIEKKRVGFGKNVAFVTKIEDNRLLPELNGETFDADTISNYEDLRGMLL